MSCVIHSGDTRVFAEVRSSEDVRLTLFIHDEH